MSQKADSTGIRNVSVHIRLGFCEPPPSPLKTLVVMFKVHLSPV